ncbi:MAG: hypothetical protein ABI243_04205 [Lapillicoccus sp.]
MPRTRKARLTDIAEIATSLPEVTREGDARPSYAVRGKGFVSAREPRKDALVEGTGERLAEVITDAWIAVAPKRVTALWLADRGGGRP